MRRDSKTGERQRRQSWGEKKKGVADLEEKVNSLEVAVITEREHSAEMLAQERECSADMLKQRDGAYSERNKLVRHLSVIYPSHLCRHPDDDETWDDDWRWIVCVHGPTGQMTWHIHVSEVGMFNHLRKKKNHWDGHTTEEKYQRLSEIGKVEI